MWCRYSPALPKAVIEDGRISEAQLEAIVLAGQRHRHVHSGTRDGFLIGDGTGMGKGRTIAAIIYDNWLQGRKKVRALAVPDSQRGSLPMAVACKTRIHSVCTPCSALLHLTRITTQAAADVRE